MFTFIRYVFASDVNHLAKRAPQFPPTLRVVFTDSRGCLHEFPQFKLFFWLFFLLIIPT